MFSKVLVAIDPAHTERAHAMIDQARSITAEGGTLVALAIVEDLPPYVEAQMPSELIVDGRKAAQKKVEEAIALDGIKLIVGHGEPAGAILEQAGAMGADLIVIASHRPGFADYFLGSTASKVVRHAGLSVLVLR